MSRLLTDYLSRNKITITELIHRADMLEKLEANPYTALDLPLEGTRLVYLVYTSFYLGQLHEAAGDAQQARRYFEKVIQLDPSSNFGEMAYLKLG